MGKVRNLRFWSGKVTPTYYRLTFDYGKKTIPFGWGLPESEGIRLWITIKQHFRITDDWDNLGPLPVQD